MWDCKSIRINPTCIAGNFTAVGTRWEKGSKKGIWGKRVIFDCSTNDPNATVELQYGRLDAFVAGCFFTTKWHDVMKGTSSEYPKGSVIQRGQVFVLKKYRGQRDRFRCMAWSHGKSICRKLGRLSSA